MFPTTKSIGATTALGILAITATDTKKGTHGLQYGGYETNKEEVGALKDLDDVWKVRAFPLPSPGDSTNP